MDRARFGVVEDSEAEDERQWRRIPDLEERPGRGDEREQRTDLAHGLACAEIGFLDELFGGLDRSGRDQRLCGHDVSPRANRAGPLLGAPRYCSPHYLIQPFSL
jgi:hypothetical protein